MLNHGIPEVQRELEENGNGKAVFTIDCIGSDKNGKWVVVEQDKSEK